MVVFVGHSSSFSFPSFLLYESHQPVGRVAAELFSFTVRRRQLCGCTCAAAPKQRSRLPPLLPNVYFSHGTAICRARCTDVCSRTAGCKGSCTAREQNEKKACAGLLVLSRSSCYVGMQGCLADHVYTYKAQELSSHLCIQLPTVFRTACHLLATRGGFFQLILGDHFLGDLSSW